MIVWLVRYAEIFLKGKNRHKFERRLVENIKDCLKRNKVEFDSVRHVCNRILIYSGKDCSCLRYVSGISSISKSIETLQDIEIIKRTASRFYKKGTFRITAQRLDKEFKHNSNEINIIVGSHLVRERNAKVSLEHPDTNIGIELFNKKAYLFNQRIAGLLGGLPAGIEGKVAVLLEDSYSIIAGILMIKRGCSIIAMQKNKVSLAPLKKFCYGFELRTVKSLPKGITSIAVNDTISNIKKRKFNLTIFRPLIGYDEKELKKWLKYS